MKKFVSFVLLASITLTSYSQNLLEFYGYVTDANGAPVGNHLVGVSDSLGFTIDTTHTSPNGFYYLSLAASQVAYISIFTPDCNGGWLNYDTLIFITPPGDTIWHNFTYCNNSIPNCISSISASATSAAGNTFNFTGSHSFNPTNYMWDFGDGNTSNMANPTHTYAQSGSYNATLVATGGVFGAVCSTVSSTTVNVSVWNTNCDADFSLDTTLSTPGNVILWNLSTYPGNNIGNYLWHFGDGTTSTQAFPTHSYANPGTYGLCLELFTADPMTGDSCYDVHCDTLTIDSLGNLIYKEFSGFQLVVLDPIFLQVDEMVTELSMFPNPAKGSLTLSNKAGVLVGDVTISNSVGQVVLRKNVNAGPNEDVRLDVSRLATGSYLLQYNGPNSAQVHRLIIQ